MDGKHLKASSKKKKQKKRTSIWRRVGVKAEGKMRLISGEKCSSVSNDDSDDENDAPHSIVTLKEQV